jgi:hypothetical protein
MLSLMIEGSLTAAGAHITVPVNKILSNNRLKNRIVIKGMFLILGNKGIYKLASVYGLSFFVQEMFLL